MGFIFYSYNFHDLLVSHKPFQQLGHMPSTNTLPKICVWNYLDYFRLHDCVSLVAGSNVHFPLLSNRQRIPLNGKPTTKVYFSYLVEVNWLITKCLMTWTWHQVYYMIKIYYFIRSLTKMEPTERRNYISFNRHNCPVLPVSQKLSSVRSHWTN